MTARRVHHDSPETESTNSVCWRKSDRSPSGAGEACIEVVAAVHSRGTVTAADTFGKPVEIAQVSFGRTAPEQVQAVGDARPGGMAEAASTRAEFGITTSRATAGGLSTARLMEIVEQVAAALEQEGERGTGDRAPDPIDCVVLLQAIERALYPNRVLDLGGTRLTSPIPRPAGTVDDSVIGAGRVRDVLGPGAQWVRVTSWGDVENAVARAGAGSAALVLWQRQAGPGHALALYHTVDAQAPLRWIDPDPTRGPQLISGTSLPAAAHARALILDPSGAEVRAPLRGASVPLAAPGPLSEPESRSVARALIDAPTDHGYGRGGVEFELHSGWLSGIERANEPEFIARHSATGVEVVLDFGVFTETISGRMRQRLYQDSKDPERETHKRSVLEFVSRDPFTMLPQEPGMDPLLAFDQVRRTLNRIARRSADALRGGYSGRGVPLQDIFRLADGWMLHRDAARGMFVPALPPDVPDLSMHYTVGVPIAALRRFLADLEGHLSPLANQFPLREYLNDANQFGREVGSYLSERHRLTHRDGIEIEGVLALAYTQVSAVALSAMSYSLPKWFTSVVSRTALHTVVRELSVRARNLLSRHRDHIREVFERYFLVRTPDFEAGYRQYTGRVGGRAIRPLDVAGARNYLDNVLKEEGEYDAVSQGQMLSVNGEFSDLDRSRTNQPGLLLVEVRALTSGLTTMLDAENAYRRLEAVTRNAVMEAENVPLPVVQFASATPPFHTTTATGTAFLPHMGGTRPIGQPPFTGTPPYGTPPYGAGGGFGGSAHAGPSSSRRRGGLPGGSRDARLDPVVLGVPVGGRFVVGLEPRGDELSLVEAPVAGRGKDVVGDTVYTVVSDWSSLVSGVSAAGVDLYTVDGSGQVTLAGGTVIPNAWVRHGADFIVPEAGMVLRGDSGWLGVIDNFETLLPALEELEGRGEVESFRLQVEVPDLYLVPADPADRAVHVTGVTVTQSAPAAFSTAHQGESDAETVPYDQTAIGARGTGPRSGALFGVGWAHLRWAQSWGLRVGPAGSVYDALLTAGSGSLAVEGRELDDADAVRRVLGERIGAFEPADDAFSIAAARLGRTVLVLRGDGEVSAYGWGPELVVAEAAAAAAGRGRGWIGLPTDSAASGLAGVSGEQIRWAVAEGMRFVGSRGGFFEALAAAGRAGDMAKLDADPHALRQNLARWMRTALSDPEWEEVLGQAVVRFPHDAVTQQRIMTSVQRGEDSEMSLLMPLLTSRWLEVGVRVVAADGATRVFGKHGAGELVSVAAVSGRHSNVGEDAWVGLATVRAPRVAGAGTRPADVAGGMSWPDHSPVVTAAGDTTMSVSAADAVPTGASEAQRNWARSHGRQFVEIPPGANGLFDALVQAAGGGFTAKGGEYVRTSERLRELTAEEAASALAQDPGLASVVYSIYSTYVPVGADESIDSGRASAEIVEALREPGLHPGLADELTPFFAHHLGLAVRVVEPSGVVHRYGAGRPVYVMWSLDTDRMRRWSAALESPSRHALNSPLRSPNMSDPALVHLRRAVAARRQVLRGGGAAENGADPVVRRLRGVQKRWLAFAAAQEPTSSGRPESAVVPWTAERLEATVDDLVRATDRSAGVLESAPEAMPSATASATVAMGLGLSAAIGLFEALFPGGIGRGPGPVAAAEGARASAEAGFGLPADRWVAASLSDVMGVLPLGGAALLFGGGRTMVLVDTEDGQRLVDMSADATGRSIVGRVVAPEPGLSGSITPSGDTVALVVDGGGVLVRAEQLPQLHGQRFDSAVDRVIEAVSEPAVGADAQDVAPADAGGRLLGAWALEHGARLVPIESGPNALFDAVLAAAGGLLSVESKDVADTAQLRAQIAEHVGEKIAANTLYALPSVHAAFVYEGVDRIIEEFFDSRDALGAQKSVLYRQIREHIDSGAVESYLARGIAEPGHWENVTRLVALDAVADWAGLGVLVVDGRGHVHLHGDRDAPRIALAYAGSEQTGRRDWFAFVPADARAGVAAFREVAVDRATSLTVSTWWTSTEPDIGGLTERQVAVAESDGLVVRATEAGADSFYRAVLAASGGAIQADRDSLVSTPAQLRETLAAFVLERPDLLAPVTRKQIEQESPLDERGVEEIAVDSLTGPASAGSDVLARHLIGDYLGFEVKIVGADGSVESYGAGRTITIAHVIDDQGQRWAALVPEPRTVAREAGQDVDEAGRGRISGGEADHNASAVELGRLAAPSWSTEEFGLQTVAQERPEREWRSASFCAEIDGQRACVSVALLTLDAESATRLGAANVLGRPAAVNA